MRRLTLPLPLCVALLLAGIYLLTTGGHTYASDEEQMFALTESIATRGSLTVGVDEGGAPRFSNYGPGQSMAAMPLYLAGRALAGLFPPEGYAFVTRAAVSWLNPLVTAVTGGLIALAALRLGYGRGAAAATALIYGLATIAWPHSKTFFAEPLAAALTFGAFVVALPLGEGGRGVEESRSGGEPIGAARRLLYSSTPLLLSLRASALALSGILAGLACAVKIQAGLALPLLGLWVLWVELERARLTGGGRGLRALLRAALSAVPWGVGALLGLGALGLYQWAAFGSPLRSGYGGASGVFDGSLAEGLYGLILSPGKGIVWYAPPLALLPVGLALLWRRDRPAAALCGAMAAATLLFYGKVVFWHGDGAWGPRYLNMALPFMALPLVAVVERRRLRPALLVALALAVPVQLGGVLVNLNAYLGVQRDATRRYFEPSQSPIAGHLRLAAAQLADAYALRLAPGTIALAGGFSYSEGDRAAGEQLPRWTLPEARIAVRPPAGGAVRVDLALSGCLPAPLPPADVRLSLDGADLGSGPACPPRRYAVLLAPGAAEIGISTPGWRPAEAGVDREESLGVYIMNAAASAGDEPLTLAGRLVPIPPAPAGPVALRQWSSDYRYGHWDLWPWYLTHSGLPGGPSRLLAGLWSGVALALVIVGVRSVRSVRA
jgi:hypothetical protein